MTAGIHSWLWKHISIVRIADMSTLSHSSVQCDVAMMSFIRDRSPGNVLSGHRAVFFEPEFSSKKDTAAAIRTDCRLMDSIWPWGTPTFIIDPLECDGLPLGNTAHRSHLLTQLQKGYCGSQVCDQHVPECTDTHTKHIQKMSRLSHLVVSSAELKRATGVRKESTAKWLILSLLLNSKWTSHMVIIHIIGYKQRGSTLND